MRRGFTLIEVLVCIAIIGVVIGLSIPALGLARHEAHLAACKSNLRQLHLAVQLYMNQESDGLIPGVPFYDYVMRGGVEGKWKDLAFGILPEYLGVDPPRYDEATQTYEYKPPFACPATRRDHAPERGLTYSYGGVWYVLDFNWREIDQGKRRSSSIAISDGEIDPWMFDCVSGHTRGGWNNSPYIRFSGEVGVHRYEKRERLWQN